jgi:tetratricopeptide (TPR) repeat protein
MSASRCHDPGESNDVYCLFTYGLIDFQQMNIHIPDTFLYYYPLLLKTDNLVPKDMDIVAFFRHIRSTARQDLIASWTASIGQQFEPHLAVGIALHYALNGNDSYFGQIMRTIQLKKGMLKIMPVLQALLMGHTGKYDDALVLLRDIPVDMANVPFILALKADIFFDMKDFGRAEQLYKEALPTIEYKSPIYSRLGEILLLRKDYETARSSLMMAIELDEKNVMAHYYLGDLYQLTGELDKAKKEYGICAAVDFKSHISQLAQQKLLQACFRE